MKSVKAVEKSAIFLNICTHNRCGGLFQNERSFRGGYMSALQSVTGGAWLNLFISVMYFMDSHSAVRGPDFQSRVPRFASTC